jgi:pimeloyl-[acyl-carrier protein] methyl ester esterase
MTLATHSNGDGPNLSLVHGWGLGSGALHNLALALGEHFTVNRVDLPGYGDSAAIEPLTIEAVADDLAATLPPRAMLCGWSLGAMVCLVCAARHPHLVARMTLAGATASFVARQGWPEAMSEARFEEFRKVQIADSAQQLKRFASLIHQGAAQPREAQRYMHADAVTVTNNAALLNSLDLLAQTDLRPMLTGVRQPVLLIHGDVDPLMPLAAAQRLMRELPDARLEVYGGSAHAPFASDPKRFVDSVRRFAGMIE